MKLNKYIIGTIFFVASGTVFSGQAENIEACASKAKEYADVSLNEFNAVYEGNWLEYSKVAWRHGNTTCEVKFGSVYNLNIDGNNYIYQMFSGKDSYNLNEKLQGHTGNAIKMLESRISLLERRMETVTNKLKKQNPNHKDLEEYIDNGISKSLNTNMFSVPATRQAPVTERPGTPEHQSNEVPKELHIQYVTSNKLNVRLAPNKSGTITNTLYKRQKVEVFEVKDEWARISIFYDVEVEGLSGEVARWVSTKYLSTDSPEEVQLKNVSSPIAAVLKSSDDFTKHQQVFVSASEKLVDSGKCALDDFKEIGGWWRSPKYKPNPVYFTYCGGMHKDNRIYLNTATGQTFR